MHTGEGNLYHRKTVYETPDRVIQYTTMVLESLCFTIREASYMFVRTNRTMTGDHMRNLKYSRQAFVFISGTGLDVMLDSYGIMYDADNIREAFYERFHINH